VSIEAPAPARFPLSVIPVWVIVVLGAVLVGLLFHRSPISWLPIVLYIGIMATFVIQLARTEKGGLVNRVMASIGGSVVILAIATGLLALIAA
jgi:hypothetical protein